MMFCLSWDSLLCALGWLWIVFLFIYLPVHVCLQAHVWPCTDPDVSEFGSIFTCNLCIFSTQLELLTLCLLFLTSPHRPVLYSRKISVGIQNGGEEGTVIENQKPRPGVCASERLTSNEPSCWTAAHRSREELVTDVSGKMGIFFFSHTLEFIRPSKVL